MTLLSQHFTVMLAVLIGIVTATLILRQRRSPASATAWILFIILAPYVATPAFLLFGLRRRLVHRAMGPTERRGAEVGGFSVNRMLDRYGVPPGTTGNHFHHIADAGDAKAALEEVVALAKTELLVTLYALENDHEGRAFVDSLTEKAQDGVKVKMLLDAVGAFYRPRRALRRLSEAGGEIRYFAPMIHGPFGAPINQRNHRKMVIADRSKLWSGGRNVGRHYFDTESHDLWDDLTFVAEGPMVAQFVTLHESDWDPPPEHGAEYDDPEDGTGDSRLRLIPSGADQAGDALHDLLITLIHRADRRVWIATPYFVPPDALWDTLAIACRRGIDVRLLMPAVSNQRMADLARGPYLRELSDQGAEIAMLGVMMHAKAIMVDELAIVGSVNIDARSLLLNYEAAVLLETDKDIDEVENWFEERFDMSTSGPPKATVVRRSAERLLRLIAPVL